MSATFKVIEHTIPSQHIREYPNATKSQQEAVIQLAVKQYVPLRKFEPRDGAVTIIAGHANGFPKEIYEPLWDDLLKASEAHGFEIRGIWAADTSNQGASGVLNESVQGDDRKSQAGLLHADGHIDYGYYVTASWFDHSRDLLLMINRFRDEMPRPIVGIAHSMGCAHLVNLSLIHPRLLSTLVIVEPVIQPEHAPGPNAAMMSTYRPDLWPSRKAAEAAFRKNKFFKTWDGRVLDKYIEFGLRQVPTALYPKLVEGGAVSPDAVTLMTSKHQEAWNYVRSNFESQDESTDCLLSPDLDPQGQGQFHFTRAEASITYTNLPHLRPSVLYIWGSKSDLTSPRWEVEKLRLTGTGVGGSGVVPAGKVQKVVIDGVGHLVPCEQVGMCAGHAADWLGRWLKQYRIDEEFYSNHDSKKSAQDMLVTSDEWKKRVRQPTSIIRPVKGKL